MGMWEGKASHRGKEGVGGTSTKSILRKPAKLGQLSANVALIAIPISVFCCPPQKIDSWTEK